MDINLLSDEARHEIEALIREGRMLEAIKIVRESTGAGLQQAKEFVDLMAMEMRLADDAPPKPIGPSGCAVVLAALGTTVATTVAFAL
jgi:hypothetical protein